MTSGSPVDGKVTARATESAAPQAARRRTRLPRAEREREILDAARRVFTSRGYAAGSVAEIASGVGVVEGTVYTYFETKRDLLRRVVGDFYEALIADVEAGLRSVRGAENRLRFLISKHFSVYVEDLGMCRLMLSEIRPDPALYGDAALDMNRRYTAIALGVIEEGIASGELRPDVVPSVLRDLIYGGAEHALWRFVFAGGEAPLDALGDQLADLLFNGVVANESQDDRTAERLERALAALERRAEATE